MALDGSRDIICCEEEHYISGWEGMCVVISRIELEFAYCAEKVLNLDILLMHTTNRLSDCEALYAENKSISSVAIEKSFEFDLLWGILDCEIQELGVFMAALEKEIDDNLQMIRQNEQKADASDIEEKLRHAEESLRHSQEQVSDIRMQAARFDGALALGREEIWNEDDWQMQTAEQRRHILRMLEKSLARELDLERQLSDCRNNGGGQINLRLVDHEEKIQPIRIDPVPARALLSEIRVPGFDLDRENVTITAQKLGKYKSSLLSMMNVKHPGYDLHPYGSTASIEDVEDHPEIDLVTEAGPEEAGCKIIPKAEQGLSRSICIDENDLKEKPWKTLIFASSSDTDKLIEDLETRVHAAEVIASDAERRCSLLTERNLKLSEEMGFLKWKVESLESLLKKTDIETKKLSAKNSGEETNLFTYLVDISDDDVCRSHRYATALTYETTELPASVGNKKSIERNNRRSKNALLAVLFSAVSICGVYFFQLETPVFC